MNGMNKIIAVAIVAAMLLVPASAALSSLATADGSIIEMTENDVECKTEQEFRDALKQNDEKRVVVSTDLVISSIIYVAGTHTIVSSGDNKITRNDNYDGVMFMLSGSDVKLTIGGSVGGMLTIDGKVTMVETVIEEAAEVEDVDDEIATEGVAVQKKTEGVAKGSMIYVKNGAELVLNSNTELIGNINKASNKNDDWNGGAVHVVGAKIVVDGATISGNSANNAGAIRVDGDGKFTMVNGKIENNKSIGNAGVSSGNGSAVVIKGSSFTMTGGEISGNSAEKGATKVAGSGDGAVYIFDGSSFIMTGGEISGNSAEGLCGGVYVKGEGGDADKFTMTGGTIGGVVDGTSSDGYSIYASGSSKIVLGGEVTVGGETIADKKVTIAGNVRTNNAVLCDVEANVEIESITADSRTYYDVKIIDGKNSAEVSPIIIASETMNLAYYINPISGSDENNGSTKDLAIKTIGRMNELVSEALALTEVEDRAIVTLYVVDTIVIEKGDSVSFIIDDESAIASMKIVDKTYKGVFDIKGTLTINNVLIIGSYSKSSAVKVTGSFIMSGSSAIMDNISKGYGGAVFIAENGKFEMNDSSTIFNCKGTYGGAVRIDGNKAEFVMNGGSINNNAATTSDGSSGGAVSVKAGTFTMNGGIITGNTVVDGASVDVGRGSAVHVFNKGSFTMNGGIITGNTSGTCNEQVSFNVSGSFDFVYKSKACISDDKVFVYSMNNNGTIAIVIDSGSKNLDVEVYGDKTYTVSSEGAKAVVGNVLVSVSFGEDIAVSEKITLSNDAYSFDVFNTVDSEKTSIKTEDGVYSEENLYICYTPIEYGITYDLVGGQVSGNPETYNIESSDFVLNCPVLTGYKFIGWTGTGYVDPTTSVKVESGSKGELTFVANWGVEKYTVTWNNFDGSILEKDENVDYGTAPSYDGDAPVKASDAMHVYSFIGWSSELATVTGNVTYTAVFSETAADHTITYKVNDNVVKTETYAYGSEVTPYTYTKTGYVVSAWNGPVPTTMPAEDLVFTATMSVIYVPVPTPVPVPEPVPEPEKSADVSTVVSEDVTNAAASMDGNKLYLGVSDGKLDNSKVTIDAGADNAGKAYKVYVYQNGSLVQTEQVVTVTETGSLTVDVTVSNSYVLVSSEEMNVVGANIDATTLAVAGGIMAILAIGFAVVRRF